MFNKYCSQTTCGIKSTANAVGRLKHFIAHWEKLTSNPVILEFVKGVKIEFQNSIEPAQTMGRTCHFNVREQAVVESEIQKLIQKGVIIPSVHEEGEFIFTIFLRSKKDGLHRTIFNLKQFNKFVQYRHFKMDTLGTVIKIMTPGCFMASIDIKNAYYLLPIHKEHQKFLKGHWQRKFLLAILKVLQ